MVGANTNARLAADIRLLASCSATMLRKSSKACRLIRFGCGKLRTRADSPASCSLVAGEGVATAASLPPLP